MKATKDTIKVKLDVRPGSMTPVQKQAWHKFWRKLIVEVKEPDNAKR